MRTCMLLLLAIVLLGTPAVIRAQSEEEPEPGVTAASTLPVAEIFGEEWLQADIISPDAIEQYGFTMSPDVFREGAAGIYLGPDGSRAIVVNLLLTDNRVAIRKSWEDAGDLMSAMGRPVATDYERDRELELLPAPEGCLEAKRAEGTENVFQTISGTTLCAADDESVLLVMVYGPVNGLAGVEASDAITVAIVSGDKPAVKADKPEDESTDAATAFELQTVDIAFVPKELTILADTDVTITVTNNGVLQHDFVVDEAGVATDLLNGGESGFVVVNLPAGTYTFYCSVPGHKEAGMVGTLIVG